MRRLVLLAIGVPLLAAAGWIADVFLVDGNFRVATADLYRSGQLRADQWQDTLAQARYRSVLNLQGAKPDSGWYKVETKFAADNGLDHYDYGLSAHVAPTLQQMREIVAVLRAAPKPILIHCKNGSDRSGLVAALYRLAVEHQPARVAEGQLSLWYGHFPWFGSRSAAMDAAFHQFVSADTAEASSVTPGDRPL